ncbi:MAG: hemolysin family protein [Methanomicrobiaceae archaeon]|nr:hemolysin family protein [Methanomicrobiaceae archaeon]
MEIIIILILVLANGFFALSEFAVISAKRALLHQRAIKGDERSRIALELAEEPTRFLSTIQVGITLVGILAGAFGGATIATEIASSVESIPLLAPYSSAVGIGLVVLIITYLTLVFGELIPKQIALSNAERFASSVAQPMQFISIMTAPIVYVLSLSTDVILLFMGISPQRPTTVTEEEVREMIEECTQAGIFEQAEQDIVKGVFRMADQSVKAVLTPRPEIIGLDVAASYEENWSKIIESSHTYFPVYDENLDTVLGIVSVRDIWARMLSGQPVDIEALLRRSFFVPESIPVLRVLELFKKTGTHIVLVTDEFGSIQGVVTFHDILESIVGDIPSTNEEVAESRIIRRDSRSWLIDGTISIEEFKEQFSFDRLPGEGKGYFQTLSGFMMMQLESVPAPGDRFVWGGLQFEVVDMDGNRVDKVLVTRRV